MGLLSNLFGSKTDDKIQEIVKDGGLIIDVRRPFEFASGHVQGSKNIPLDNIESSISELKKHSGNIVLCCASGNRSGMAKQKLEKHGIEAYNGGGWRMVDGIKS